MDLQDQLKNFFPDHKLTDNNYSTDEVKQSQDEPIICKYEKRKGKPITILENFKINNSELKIIAKDLKKFLSVGGTVKENYIKF
jgi:translation initiation factor 1